jgi:hypothetical protein
MPHHYRRVLGDHKGFFKLQGMFQNMQKVNWSESGQKKKITVANRSLLFIISCNYYT